ncbi:MAG: trehalose 6-phosphate phosphatase [Clostridia bacterium]|nr:trehalose 6-phosphate phosphatase [Clostridia bacterium]
MFDYDGTLVPIAGRPEEAYPDAGLKELLKKITSKPGTCLAVISGRALEGLKNMFQGVPLILAGNHGSLLQFPGRRPVALGPVPSPELTRKIAAAAGEAARGIEGLLVEDKGTSVALHYRLAEPQKGLAAAARFRELVEPYLASGYEIITGKKMVEARPRGSHKGLAVNYLISRFPRAFPCFFGDDLTDEDAFAALGSRGLSVLVGRPRETLAAYHLPGPEAVRELLVKLAGFQ